MYSTTREKAVGPNPRSNQMKANVMIVDDHEIVREGIRGLLNSSRPDWTICAEASDGQQAIEAAARLRPDVIILDLTMPGMNGFEVASHITKRKLNTRILIFTMHSSDELSEEIRKAGAHGYVQKSQASRDLVDAIECLLQGGTFFEAERVM